MAFYITKNESGQTFKMNEKDSRFSLNESNPKEFSFIAIIKLKRSILGTKIHENGHKVKIQEDINGQKYYIFLDFSAIKI